MAASLSPIIALHQRDDAVSAFFTADEAMAHFREQHGLQDAGLTDWQLFDGQGRPVVAVLGPDGLPQGLRVASAEGAADAVRARVRHRSLHARRVLDESRHTFADVDETPLGLAEEDLDFELFVWRLANVLRPDGGPSDPVLKEGHIGKQHSAGWWHNTFAH